MKRVIPLALLAASVVLVIVVNASAGPGDHHGGRTITVVEHATTDAVTNGTAGDDVGDVLTFANDVFNSADTKKVGTDQGPASAWSWANRGSAAGPRSCQGADHGPGPVL